MDRGIRQLWEKIITNNHCLNNPLPNQRTRRLQERGHSFILPHINTERFNNYIITKQCSEILLHLCTTTLFQEGTFQLSLSLSLSLSHCSVQMWSNLCCFLITITASALPEDTLSTVLTLSLPASLSTSIFSLQYQYKISWLVVRIKELIIHIKILRWSAKFS